MGIELYPHNQTTYDKIIEMWETENRVAAVQPTGSGKSFLILKCAEKFNDVKKVVLAPSVHIFDEIRKNLGDIENLEFITYAKLQFMTEEEIKSLDVEFIALDEIHRCGAELWGKGVQRLLDLYPNAKVLGTSATPIRFLDGERDMTDELFDNNIACNITLPQAIVEGILPMPKYISALYSFDEEADILIERTNKSKNSDKEKIEIIKDIKVLKNKLDKSKGIPKILKKYINNSSGRYLVFCKDKEHLDEMKLIVVEWFNKYFKLSKLNNQVNTYEVYFDLENSSEQLENFINDNSKNTLKLLFSINKLNEGIHIKNLDGVILLRPTTSPTMYYQQIGRAMDAGRNDQTLILDLVNNFSSIRTNTLKDDLEKEAKEFCGKKGIDGENEVKFISRFNVFDESFGIVKLFNDIENRLYDSWDLNIKALEQFYNREGHSDIPNKHIEIFNNFNVNLGNFCGMVKASYSGRTKQIILTDEKIYELSKYGFNLNIKYNRYAWDYNYQILNEYYNMFGNYIIKKGLMYNGINLYNFVGIIRKKYKENSLDDISIIKLQKINFIFDPHDEKWSTHYNLLKTYYDEYKNCNVPTKYVSNNTNLGKWVSLQRTAYKMNKLSNNKITKLEGLEFNFNVGSGCTQEIEVICIETKKVFYSISHAGIEYNTHFSGISKCCKGKAHSAGELPDGTRLHWMYYDEYIKLYGEVEESKVAM